MSRTCVLFAQGYRFNQGLTSFVSGLSQLGQRTNRLMKPSRRFWSFSQSCAPLTIYRSSFAFICTCAPSSHPKNFVTSIWNTDGMKKKKKIKILTCRWTIKGFSNSSDIDQNSFNTVACAFNLGSKFRHFITIEHIVCLSINIDHSHDCSLILFIWC